FQTGITSLDQFEGYVLLKKNQILQKRANVINQIKIRLNDVQKSASFAAELERRFSYRTEGWEESNQNVFSIFVVQNGVMYSTIFAIVIVAAFGIFNIISTVVNEKVRDIAILKSMGFATHDIQKIFLYQGLIVGFIGALLGWLLGWILVEILAALPLKIEGDQTFVQTNGFILYRTPWAYVAAAFGALLMSSIAAVMPARKAAQVNPVDIIRGAA
ncbi:MAG: ABC transporter permease, partial [Holosporales bacterium]